MSIDQIPGIEPVTARFAERFPIVRTGERQPISHWKRSLVHKRDGYRCGVCSYSPIERRDPGLERRGTLGAMLNVDHIVPWSAGGSDRSDNLRTLCDRCNQGRSNFRSGGDVTVLPIARICIPCSARFYAGGKPEVTIPVYCACRHHESWVINEGNII